MNKCLSIGSGCFCFCFFLCFFLLVFCWRTHQKAAYQISFLGPARHKPLILWKSTAVIGWPCGSQVITLTVDSVAGGGRRGGRRIKTTNKNVTEKPGKFSAGGKLVGLFPRHSSQTGSSNCAGDERNVCLKQLYFELKFKWDVCPPLPPLFISISN